MPHKVWLRGNLNVVGSVTVVSPSGEILRSTPVAIALYDAASGNSTVIGTIQDCEGVQVSDTEVVFENAFKGDGILADVVFTISQATFSQDVVVRGRLDPTAWGFPTNSWIQIITEFYDPPRPERIRRPLRVEEDEDVRGRMVSPDFVDEVLGFGELTLWTGSAYTAVSGAREGGGAPVAKERIRGDRTFLVESVEALGEELRSLPEVEMDPGAGQARRITGNSKAAYAAIPRPPSLGVARVVAPRSTPRLAQAETNRSQGVVIDYTATIGSPVPTVFAGDTTYLVTNTVVCRAVTVEGGAVFKHKVNTTLQFNSTVTCMTSGSRPAFSTGVDDDTIGESMSGVPESGYTGTINAGGYANPAFLAYYLSSPTLSHLGIRYAKEAIRVVGNPGGSATIAHKQPMAGGGTFLQLGSGRHPTMDFRFTDFSVSQGRLGTLLSNGSANENPFQRLSLRDCYLRNAALTLAPASSEAVVLALTNNVLYRSQLTIKHATSLLSRGTPFTVYLYNNLFWGTPSPSGPMLALTYNDADSTVHPIWTVKYNLFDKAAIAFTGNGT
jgi:hypothetical protein